MSHMLASNLERPKLDEAEFPSPFAKENEGFESSFSFGGD